MQEQTDNKRFFTRPLAVLLCVCILSFILWGISVISSPFADFFNKYIAVFTRSALSYLTALLPFSLGETLLLAAPVFVIVLLIYTVIDKDGKNSRRLKTLLSVLLVLLTLFNFNCSIAYRVTSIGTKLGLSSGGATSDDVIYSFEWICDNVNALANKVDFNYNSSSKMPYDLKTLNEKLLKTYKENSKKIDFLPVLNVSVKPVALSRVMTYAHISGAYSYYTGEANINIEFPDYTLPYTVAHEMAHQRGIIREDEANFLAFIICISSDDDYIKYSGYVSMLEYFMPYAKEADPDKYTELIRRLDMRIGGEFRAYSEFYYQHHDSAIGKISDTVNDTFIKSQGVKSGSKSYNESVNIVVSYYKSTLEKREG